MRLEGNFLKEISLQTALKGLSNRLSDGLAFPPAKGGKLRCRSWAPPRFVAAGQAESPLFGKQGLQFLVEFRHNLEKIADYAVIRFGENGGFSIFVDGDNYLGRSHTGQMLDRT